MVETVSKIEIAKTMQRHVVFSNEHRDVQIHILFSYPESGQLWKRVNVANLVLDDRSHKCREPT
jgi:hypothetical protein